MVIALGDDALFNDVHAGKKKLRALFANRAALLALGGVWRRSNADAFDVLEPRSQTLKSLPLCTTSESSRVGPFGAN